VNAEKVERWKLTHSIKPLIEYVGRKGTRLSQD